MPFRVHPDTSDHVRVKCAICQRDDRPMTREHVFARWLTQRLGSAGAARASATVCADCNAGWMSTLEVAFRRAAFARPRAGPIPAPDRTTISRWAAKTAILLADALVADARVAPLVDARDRPALMRGMPLGIEVFIARRRNVRSPIGHAVASDGSVAVQVDDLALFVAREGVLTSASGTRVWPLRTHQLRWDTLPVLS